MPSGLDFGPFLHWTGSANDQVDLAYGLHNFGSAFPPLWKNPAVARFDFRHLSGFGGQYPATFKQMTKLGDIQVQLQFPRFTFPCASRQITFLLETRVGLFRQIPDRHTERLTIDQVR